MTREEIENANKLIAEFMGIKYIKTADPSISLWNIQNRFPNMHIVVGKPEMGITTSLLMYRDGQLIFHSSWDWLMPVVEKIESLVDLSTSLDIYKKSCQVRISDLHGIEIKDLYYRLESKIESVFKSCVEFIKWYNENKQSNGL